MFVVLVDGILYIEGFLEGEDICVMVCIFSQLGVCIEMFSLLQCVVYGVGIDGLKVLDVLLDCGNVGIGMCLLVGLLVGQLFDCMLIGDELLFGCLMCCVIGLLLLMGVRIDIQDDGILLLYVYGGQMLYGIDFVLLVVSVQVKLVVLLVGLYVQGEICVIELYLICDYIECMLFVFGVDIVFLLGKVCLCGGQCLCVIDIVVFVDFFLVVFYLVVVSIIFGFELCLKQVGLNLCCIGLLYVLCLMGVDIIEENLVEQGGELVVDLVVCYVLLKGVCILEMLVLDMIDEFLVLFVVVVVVEGQIVVSGVVELRVKELDCFVVMVIGLCVLGMQVDEIEDGVILYGGVWLGSGIIESYGDYCIVMVFVIVGQISDGEVCINDIVNVVMFFLDFDGLVCSVGFNLV